MVRQISKPKKDTDENLDVSAQKVQIAERIRKMIRESGGNAVVSEKSGVNLKTVSNYTRGMTEPKIISLLRITKVCGVSLDWIATGNGPHHPVEPQPALAATDDSEPQTIADVGQRLRRSREFCDLAVQAVGWEPPRVVWEALRTAAFGYNMKIEDMALLLEAIKYAVEDGK